MRIAVVDPPAFTPQYDHALASALARQGETVRLVTSSFRFGAVPEPEGYERVEAFYPLSSRIRTTLPLRLVARAAEHPLALRRLATLDDDVVHVQWLAWPGVDRLLRLGRPAVFTAHDVLPRRTAHREDLWRRLFAKFARIVVHSEHGRDRLAAIGVPSERLRVIPHPVFPSDPERRDDGRTLLALGVIRPYKGLADAVEAVRRIDGARLLVVGDPRIPLEGLRERAGERAEWRLGYVPDAEVDRALGETTVALFPYRPELDQSGALLRALGAGVPAVAYDVAGIAEPIRRFGAGRVVPAGEVGALASAARELLDDPDALDSARAGAHRAREELTWAAAAAAHVHLYRELL